MPVGDRYTNDEWFEIVNSAALFRISDSDLHVIHRHYVWAEHLFLWHGLVWSVIEAFPCDAVHVSDNAEIRSGRSLH